MSDGCSVGLSNQVDTGTARAKVVTAKNNDLKRIAGNPTRAAAPAATTIPIGRAMRTSRSSCVSVYAQADAPTPANANWPRLTRPAHPVSTASDTARIP